METIDIRDAQTQLARLLKRVAAGEEIVIAKDGKPVARLVAYKEAEPPIRRPGSLKGKIWISPDFDKVDKEIEALFYDGPIEPPA
jgi:prevent-host-death family protein